MLLKKCFGETSYTPEHIFNLSFEKGVFPGNLKVAEITPLFKTGKTAV